jgi:fimbrial chaperone protein/chaperone protein EcpD
MKKTFIFIVVIFIFISSHAQAAFVLGGTRVVYNAGDNDVTLSVMNTSSLPYAGQAWTDPFHQEAGNSIHSDAPNFIITPPVFRVEPGETQKLRFILATPPPSEEVESVYWINVQEIPPEPKNSNTLQFAQRIRIKLFYRPDALNELSASEAPTSLKISLTEEGVSIKNPAPFSVSFFSPLLEDKTGKKHPLDELLTLLPGEEFIVKCQPCGYTRFHFQSINDFGGIDDHEPRDISP